MVPNLNSIYILPLIASCFLLMGFETNKDSTIEGNLTIDGKLDIKDDSNNVAIGSQALSNNDSGKLNLALGAYSLKNNGSGENNVGLGSGSIRSLTDGSNNIGIGFNSGDNFTGNNSIFIGSGSSVESGHKNAENQIVIGTFAKGRGANTVVLGSDTVTESFLKGNVTILKGGSQGNLEIDGSLTVKSPNGINASWATFGGSLTVDGNSVLDSVYVGKNLEVTETLKVKERAEILSLYTKGTIHFYPNEGAGEILEGAALKIQFQKLDDAGNNEYLDDDDPLHADKSGANRVAVIGDGAIDTFPAIEFIKIDDHMVVNGDLNIKTGSKLFLGENEVTVGGSDSRWKKDIKPLESSLDNIAKLRGVNYQWNRDQYPDKRFSDKPQIGVIAQEVEQVFPQVVNTDSKGYKYVDYNKLVAPLIEAVKELNQKNQTQQALIANLTERLERLEAAAQ